MKKKLFLVFVIGILFLRCGIVGAIVGIGGNKNSGNNSLLLLLLGSRILASGGTTVNVTGTVKYEDIGINTTTFTLITSTQTAKPARAVTVQLVDSNNNVITSVASSDTGTYTLTGKVTSSTFTINMVSEMVKTTSPTYSFKVVNSSTTAVGSTYSVASSAQKVSSCTSSCTVNLTAADSNRGSGPFSILDVIYTAITKVLAADSTTVFPSLYIKWVTSSSSVGSYFTTGNAACGTGVSYCIFLLGNRSSDSDEFDKNVVAHEFTHYLENTQSRADSIGGSHSTNDLLEPRVAYGEGLGNAMGSVFMDNPQYSDTTASGGFGFNVETGTHTLNGFYSEGSVQSVIWDLYDSVSDTKNAQTDNLNYSFSKIWSGIIALKSITSITYLHEFILAVKAANAADTAAIDNILTMESIASNEAGEANVNKNISATFTGLGYPANPCDGSTAAYHYNPIVNTTAATNGANAYAVTAHSGSQFCGMVAPANNKLFGSQFFRLAPINSGTMTVTATDTALGAPNMEDPDVYIFNRGAAVATCNVSISEVCNVSVTAGNVYIVEVRSYSICGLTSGNVTACSVAQKTNSGVNNYTVKIDLP